MLEVAVQLGCFVEEHQQVPPPVCRLFLLQLRPNKVEYRMAVGAWALHGRAPLKRTIAD